MDLAKLIVTLAVRVKERKAEIGRARTTLRACLEQVENIETNGVRARVEVICPDDVLWLARELCNELHGDHAGAFDRMLSERRALVNSMGVVFPLR